MRKLSLLVLLTALLLPFSLFSQQQSQLLTNKDILDMLKAPLTGKREKLATKPSVAVLTIAMHSSTSVISLTGF